MTISKMQLTLEVAYDLVEKVLSAICHSEICKDEITDFCGDTMQILKQLILLDNKLEGVKQNDNRRTD